MDFPASFKICGRHSYRKDAAIWSFREVNRLSTMNWFMGRGLLKPAFAHFEEKAFAEVPVLESRAMELINDGKQEESIVLINN